MSSLSYFFSAVDTDTEMLARAGSSVYTYQLSLAPNFSFFPLFSLTLPQVALMFYQRSRGDHQVRRETGVCHGDDLMFIFPMEMFPAAVETEVSISSLVLIVTPTFSGSEKNARKTPGYNREFCQQRKANNIWTS